MTIDISFKENVYELAFGDGASDKEFTDVEVLSRLGTMVTEFQKFEDHIEELSEADEGQTQDDWEFYERLRNLIRIFRADHEG